MSEMMPVSKYVDMEHVDFKQAWERKGEVGVWELLNFDLRLMVMAEYIGDRVEEAMYKMGISMTSGINAAVKDAITKQSNKSGLDKSGTSDPVHIAGDTKPE